MELCRDLLNPGPPRRSTGCKIFFKRLWAPGQQPPARMAGSYSLFEKTLGFFPVKKRRGERKRFGTAVL